MFETNFYPPEVIILGDKVRLISNVKEFKRINEMTKEEEIMYQYDQIMMTKDEYINSINQENKELEGVVSDLTQLLLDKGVIL